MSTAEWILAVAAWCSVPSGNRLYVDQVQACRERLLVCLKESHASFFPCFEKEKLR